MKKKKSTPQKKNEPIELFSVYSVDRDHQIYPGDGVPEKEAERLSKNLLAETYIKSRGFTE